MAPQPTTPNPPTPRTPSTLYKDNFDLTPNTQTTTSFADSGFFSSPPALGKEQYFGTGYKDWVLFPVEEDDGWEGEGSGFLDTRGFFRDADECVMGAEEQDGLVEMEGSITVPAYDSQNLAHDLEDLAISSPQSQQSTFTQSQYSSNPPPSPRPSSLTLPYERFSQLEYHKEEEDTTMLQHWHTQKQRHESIAYRFEQPPYTQREHLLVPVFRQRQRVDRRRRDGSGSGVNGRKLRRERALVGI